MMRRTPAFASALLLAALALATAAGDANGARLEESLRLAYEGRAGAASVVYLYRASELGDVIADRGALREGLARVAGAADAQPEVRAHARELLRGLLKLDGAWDEAERLGREQGFLTRWRVLGPYSDEGKLGWGNFYDPERTLDLSGKYFGKDHEIAWRKAPEAHRGAELVRLDALLDPSEKVTGYAATFVKVPRDTPAVLRGGFNEAHKLWVDGEEVGAARRYNGRAFDQFAHPCTLRRGWNVILVKVCNQDSGWNFSLRLTDREGRALTGWESSAEAVPPGETLAAVLAKDGGAPEGFAPYDPERELEKGAAAGPAQAILYGEFLTRQKTFDRTEPKDARVLREAAEALGKDSWAWVAVGEAEGDLDRRREAYSRAAEAEAPRAPALLRLGQLYQRRGMPLVAAQYYAKALEEDPQDLAARCALARLQLGYLTDGEAAREIEGLAAKYPGATCVQEARLESLRALGRSELWLASTEAFAARHQSAPGPLRELLQANRSAGRVERALALYDLLLERFPLDRGAAAEQARYLLNLDRPGEARQALAPALGWAPDWADGHQLAGDLALALGEREGALAAYRRALELKPQDEGLRGKLEHLRPDEASFYASYRVEAGDLPILGAADREAQLVTVLDNTVVQVQKSGLASRYVQHVLEVLQTGAARQMQYYPIAFDPDRQSVRLLDATVLRGDGSRQRAASFVTDALSDPQYRLYYRNRNLVLDFGGLRPGDRVWVEYLLSDTGEAGEYGEYFGDLVPFSSSSPVLLKKYTLLAPADLPLKAGAVRMAASPIAVSLGGQKIYSWSARDMARAQQEPSMPGPTETGPYLHISTFSDWPAMGRWYSRFIQDQWESSPAVREQALALGAGLATPEEKVRAVHRWVVQQTRYVGLEFGVHGYKPYKVRQIFERRFGDCKDKALLLTAMLREVGVEACMVLVRTRDHGEIDPEPASLAVFNHAICYVPGLDLFLDGTAEYSGLRELPWMDQGVQVLLVWPDGETKVVRTPVDRPSANRFEAVYDLRPEAGATEAPYTSKVRFEGQECAWVRRLYQDEAKWAETIEKGLSGSFPGTKIRSAKLSDTGDINRPLELETSGVLGSVGRADGEGRMSYPAWPGSLDLAGQYGGLTARVHPLEIGYPWSQQYTVRFALPAGAEAEPPAPVERETPFGSVRRTVVRGEGTLAVTTTVILAARRVEPADYAAFRAFCIEVDRVASERVRIRFQGGDR